MSTFTIADDDTLRLFDVAMKTHHTRLVTAGVRVSVIAAAAPIDEDTNEPVGEALKHHGYPCMACVRIIKHSDRVQGMADAEIKIDGDRWPLLSREEKIAVFDHELTHLELVGDVDDGGRPKLKMRLHDHQLGWFDEVAERHGKFSIEQQQAQQLVDDCDQTYFAFMGAVAGGVAEMDASLAAMKRAHGIVDEEPSAPTMADVAHAAATTGKIVETFQEFAKKNGGSVTIEAGGKSVTIDEKGVRR